MRSLEQPPTIEQINEGLFYVWYNEDEYLKVMPKEETNCIIIQEGESSKQYLLRAFPLDEYNYCYEYSAGICLNGTFYKRETIFKGALWHNPRYENFSIVNLLYEILAIIILDDSLEFPELCLSEYGQDSQYQILKEDKERILN